MPDQSPDEALIHRIAERDRRAMDALVSRHAGPLFRYARSTAGGDAALAEDALQEAFLSVWRHAAGFSGPSARAWLYTITRNAVRHEAKKRGVVKDAPMDEAEVSLSAAGFGVSGSNFLCALESKDQVHKALATLPDHEREIVLLVDVDGLSIEEAGTALELSIAATKSRLHRARLHLMAILTEES